MRHPTDPYARWPTLLASVTFGGAALALDITTHAPLAYGCLVLAASAFGAFLYAEGARHREWWRRNDHEERRSDDVPSDDDVV